MSFTDLTFITNEQGENLLTRFKSLIKDTRYFDVLVGYFFSSGFYSLYRNLDKTEKIRILIGISTDSSVYDMISRSRRSEQLLLNLSSKETKNKFSNKIKEEMDEIEEDFNIEEGVNKFIEWLKNGKMEIRAYPSANIHAKLYIMTFHEDDRDAGRVITGSSNFTQAGLIDNLEFNVELKNRSDYEFSKKKFDELWQHSVDVSDKYIETIKTKTWLNQDITPYELYLKFLYEYFKEKINLDQEFMYRHYLPENFMDLEYQSEAVKDAQTKLEQYGGVFVSDVVGLGKTYIASMLAQQLDGRTLVLAPPVLIDKNNPGSWPNVFNDFRVPAVFESIGKIDQIARKNNDMYKNIIIDEAHRFRTETTTTYEKLAQICRGKRVILVTATPLNNKPNDILAQIKLFQKSRNSNIPNMKDLESFFKGLSDRLKGLDRKDDFDEYIKIVKDNARQIREKVLKYLMIRRTRSEITNYFSDDLSKQGLNFPEVEDPKPVYYQLNKTEDEVFKETIKLLTKDIKFTRYIPVLYLKSGTTHTERQSQINLKKLMMLLLVKRLESSFYAFRRTLERFINSYVIFIREFENGNVYVSKDDSRKLLELLENSDYDGVQSLIDTDRAERFDATDFKDEFYSDLQADLQILNQISSLWTRINRDPKLDSFKELIKTLKPSKKNKIIVFTESKETAEYLKDNLNATNSKKTLLFTGSSKSSQKDAVIENFDAKAVAKKDDYQLLISTEVLSEGVNLHRSNAVINYDIPWNPTRLMQRVGRINRIDTKFNKIYTYNFFPTTQSNDIIKLKEAAEAKIHYFIEMLGNDARLLTDGEDIKSHDLFESLNSRNTITGEDEEETSELKYLKIIRDLRDKNEDMFDKIKRLPKKARSSKRFSFNENGVLTYFRKGKLHKFYLSTVEESNELDFIEAAEVFESVINESRQNIDSDFYPLLQKNKLIFEEAVMEEPVIISKKRGGRDASSKLLKILKSTLIRNYKGYTEDDEDYIEKLKQCLEDGAIPKKATGNVIKKINEEMKNNRFNPLVLLSVLKSNIHQNFLLDTATESSSETSGPIKVILSEFLKGECK